MGFHFEEEGVVGGTIDNRTKGLTILRINFVNHTSSLVRLQGNPCRDLAGSLWAFTNPYACMDDFPGEECYFIPGLCEGAVGHISHSRKGMVSDLPPDEYYDRLFDPDQEDPPTKVAPILELEWFSEKFKQVEIDCERMTLELVEMVWSLSAEEAAAEAALVKQTRERIHSESSEDFEGDMELVEEWLEDEGQELHEIEELCFLIVQEFVHQFADGSDEKNELHNDLLKLQEQIGGAFAFFNNEMEFDEVDETISLLKAVLPFVDRAVASAKFHVEETTRNLVHLRASIVRLREELAKTKD